MAKTVGEVYRGSHTAPGREGAPAHNLAKVYPDDVYGPNAARSSGPGGPDRALDEHTVSILHALKGKPHAEVTIHRAAPAEATDINKGDWVTVNRDYAKAHGERSVGPGYKILSKVVHAHDIHTNGDSIHEFGYNPQKHKEMK